MTGFQKWVDVVVDEVSAALKTVSADEVAELQREIMGAKRIFIAGKGRSGLFMRAFAMRLMHLGLHVYVVDDVTTPGIAADDVLIMASGSGRTASLVHYASKAKEIGASVALITAYPDSPVGHHADKVVRIPAPTSKVEASSSEPHSAQPMANLFEQTLVLMLDICTLQLMKALSKTGEQMFARHANLE
ncbi:MAG: 6-phospho-3-hexuloisomerase [Anaerolineaceae bacterium]|nr:6-phospho-3-hexuloisomerase [Anaerolineaceae bacterium]